MRSSGRNPMKRLFDISGAILLAHLLWLPMLLVAGMIKVSSKGPVLYWSDRIGRGNKVFKMPKFRTMRKDTPAVATHLLSNSGDYITPLGRFLRRLSIDEFPQLLSILRGDMSFVGPRPALFNQYDLIALRTCKGIHRLTPGISGWAQINGRDDLSIPAKVKMDEYYGAHQSFGLDIRILAWTVIRVLTSRGISH